jgi:hypothetical protein
VFNSCLLVDIIGVDDCLAVVVIVVVVAVDAAAVVVGALATVPFD